MFWPLTNKIRVCMWWHHCPRNDFWNSIAAMRASVEHHRLGDHRQHPQKLYPHRMQYCCNSMSSLRPSICSGIEVPVMLNFRMTLPCQDGLSFHPFVSALVANHMTQCLHFVFARTGSVLDFNEMCVGRPRSVSATITRRYQRHKIPPYRRARCCTRGG